MPDGKFGATISRVMRLPLLAYAAIVCILGAIALNTVLAVRETAEQNSALRQQRAVTIIKHNLDELQQMLLDEHEQLYAVINTRAFYRRPEYVFPMPTLNEYADAALRACGDAARCTSQLRELKNMLGHLGDVGNRLARRTASNPLSASVDDALSDELDARFIQTMEKVVEIRMTADARLDSSVNSANTDARRISDLLAASGIGAAIMLVALFARNAHITRTLREALAKADRYQAELHYQARHDALTGLPNRAQLEEQLLAALQRAAGSREKAFVIFVDLDRFKEVNDSLGHRVGDALLAQIATRLEKVVGERGLTARYGGDEFIIVADRIGETRVGALLAELLETLADPVYVGEHELFIEASMGVSVFPSDGRDADTLVRNADAAMYLAKENGRNQYQFYRAELSDAAASRLKISTKLRRALKEGKLRVLYQPQIDMASGRVVGAEALLRWTDPELGDVPPSLFIPISEETGLIRAIGEWVLGEACRECAQWNRTSAHRLRVSVNVSPLQLDHSDLVRVVSDTLHDAGLAPELLELEVTEGALMRNADHAAKLLARLRALGVRVAIDDFGTGYSSLSYLNRFGADRLKIDRAFVREIGQNAQTQAITLAIIGMAEALNFELIAEGVETIAHRDFLLSHGCGEAQGFLYSPAVSGQELHRMAAVASESAAQTL